MTNYLLFIIDFNSSFLAFIKIKYLQISLNILKNLIYPNKYDLLIFIFVFSKFSYQSFKF
jgi:hypothetical protein